MIRGGSRRDYKLSDKDMRFWIEHYFNRIDFTTVALASAAAGAEHLLIAISILLIGFLTSAFLEVIFTGKL